MPKESNVMHIAPELHASVHRAAELIDQADALVIAAGAGMGVDSGLPDFRGAEGFWRAYPALRSLNLDFYSIASPRTFHTDPALAWGFYGHRLNLYRKTQPHAGFGILQRWGRCMEHGYTVFTSNVDGQFQRAGFDPGLIHECHGSIHHLQCLHGCTDDIWSAEAFDPDVDMDTCRLRNEAPSCPHCAGLARPNILMFGDMGWLEDRTAGQQAIQNRWLHTVERPVAIELGAGTAVPSVRYFTEFVTRHAGGRMIRINPREAEVRSAHDVSLPVGALQGLAWIDQVLLRLE